MGSIALESIKLSHSAPVELFVFDLTELGGSLLRYAPAVNELGQAIVWQGYSYTPFPIQAGGFKQVGNGPFPRPRLGVSNVLGTLGPYVRQFDGLRGATVIRKRTMARFLDAANFAGGNPDADPLAEYPDEVWRIDRTLSRNRLAIEWELANPMDVVGCMLPARVIHENWCPWEYRGSDCGYTGPPVAEVDDTATTDPAKDRCSKRLTGCKLRFGRQVLPAGFFPGVGRVRQV